MVLLVRARIGSRFDLEKGSGTSVVFPCRPFLPVYDLLVITSEAPWVARSS